VTLTEVSLVGGVRIWVPAGIRVEVSGFRLIGGTRFYGRPEPRPGAPTVHVRAFGLVGGSGSAVADRPSSRRRIGAPSGEQAQLVYPLLTPELRTGAVR
jgi:hypothetical protein